MSYYGLLSLVQSGVISALPENINAASIDLRLGSKILVERKPFNFNYDDIIYLEDKRSRQWREYDIADGGYTLRPGEFILAHTMEVFNLPDNISAEYKLKSTMARNGLNHMTAGWADAGWHGSVLTLEFHNVNRYHSIHLTAGEKCGQMVFFRHEPVPKERSYASRGSYNNDQSVQAGKGIR